MPERGSWVGDLVGFACFWVCGAAVLSNGDLDRFGRLCVMPLLLLGLALMALTFAVSVLAIPAGLAMLAVSAWRGDFRSAMLGLLCVAAGSSVCSLVLWGA